MEVMADTGIFLQGELVRINRVHHHKKVHSIGDLTQCNGIMVHPTMFLQEKGESYRDFPAQHPTTPEYGLWLCAIGSLTVHGHQLRHPLGVHTADSHHPDTWFTIMDHFEIYQQLPTQEYEVYLLGLYNILDWYGRHVHTCMYVQKIDPS